MTKKEWGGEVFSATLSKSNTYKKKKTKTKRKKNPKQTNKKPKTPSPLQDLHFEQIYVILGRNGHFSLKVLENYEGNRIQKDVSYFLCSQVINN